MTLVFNKLRAEDSPKIHDIEQAAHISPWTLSLIEQSFGARSWVWGAFDDGKLLGYYFADDVFGEVSLTNICVANEQQGKGIGRALMQHLIHQAQQSKTERIFLEVRASNEPALKLYIQCGFEQVGLRKGYYSVPFSTDVEDAVVMSLALQ